MYTSPSSSAVYTPASLITVFAKLLRYAQEERTLLSVRGVYRRVGVKSYGGVFYDQVQEEGTDHTLTSKIPERLRVSLQDGEIYVLEGALERSLRKDGTIALLFAVTAVQGREERTYSEQEEHIFALLHKRLARGIVDVNAVLKQKLYAADRPKIAMVYGEQAIVHADVETALGAGQKSYEFVEFRVNMSRLEDMCDVLEEITEGNYDAYALIRGGGSGLEVFSERQLLERIVDSAIPLLSAVGHAQDTPLVEQFADKVFATPTALGAFLRGIAEDVVLEREQSRVHLLEELQKQFAGERARERDMWEKERVLERKELEGRQEVLQQQVQRLKKWLFVGGISAVVLVILAMML